MKNRGYGADRVVYGQGHQNDNMSTTLLTNICMRAKWLISPKLSMKKLSPFRHPIRSEIKTNRDSFACSFAALCANYSHLLLVLIGSF